MNFEFRNILISFFNVNIETNSMKFRLNKHFYADDFS